MRAGRRRSRALAGQSAPRPPWTCDQPESVYVPGRVVRIVVNPNPSGVSVASTGDAVEPGGGVVWARRCCGLRTRTPNVQAHGTRRTSFDWLNCTTRTGGATIGVESATRYTVQDALCHTRCRY